MPSRRSRPARGQVRGLGGADGQPSARRRAPPPTAPRRTRARTVAAHASAGVPVGSHPRPGATRISVCPLRPTNDSPPGPSEPDHSKIPRRSSDPSAAPRSSTTSPTSEIAHTFARIEGAKTARPAQLRVRDQLDDVAGRIDDVARERVPVVEAKRRLRSYPARRAAALVQPAMNAPPRTGLPARAARNGETAALRRARTRSRPSPPAATRRRSSHPAIPSPRQNARNVSI